MRLLVLIALVVLTLRPAAAATPRILLFPLDRGCREDLTQAVHTALGTELAAELVSLNGTDVSLSCMGEECADRLRSQYPELRDAILIGGHADEQDGHPRYRVWAYDYATRRTAFGDKWLPGRVALRTLGEDIAGSLRALLEDFEAACCLTAVEQREQGLTACAPAAAAIPGGQPLLVAIFNRPDLSVDQRKQREDLVAFENLGGAADHALTQVAVVRYTGGHEDTIGRMAPQQQAAWLQQLHRSQLIRVEWRGTHYSVALCRRDAAAEGLECRWHRRIIEDRPAEPQRMHRELLLRVRDLVGPGPLTPPPAVCQRPFISAYCMTSPTVAPPVAPWPPPESTDKPHGDAPLPLSPTTPRPLVRPTVPIIPQTSPPRPAPLIPEALTAPRTAASWRLARGLSVSSFLVGALTSATVGGLMIKSFWVDNRNSELTAAGSSAGVNLWTLIPTLAVSGGLTLLSLPVLISVEQAYRRSQPVTRRRP